MKEQRNRPAREASDEQEVLSYWFPPGIHEAGAETYREQWMRWFAGGPEVEWEITERFAEVLEQARRGELDSWAVTPRGRLALILVLDQFSRSVYKGTPLAYAQDPAALRLAQEGIEAGVDRDMEVAERLFFTLPLGHAEGPDHLERLDIAVRRAEEQFDLAPAHLKPLYEFSLGQARGHRDVVARFGRHPHRNAVLGRASTPEELEYLKNEVPVHMRQPHSKDEEEVGMSAEENEAVVRRYIEEVWNGHNLDAIDELASPDYLNHAASSAEYQRGGARRAVEWLLSVFPDHHFDVEDAVAEGDTVAVRGTCSGTHEGELMGIPPTGERFAAQQVHWFRVADGKLAEHWAVRDDLDMMWQLGVIAIQGQ